jgi:uncharacterized protein
MGVRDMGKKIYDSVHGFIKLTPLEKDLVDSYVFQRLHYIHQLGTAYLVYPGATHTRFEHSLGVMEVATRIFDRIVEKALYGPSTHTLDYWRQIVRFAALCHDLGHLPFSHLAEKEILGSKGHESWTIALINSLHLQSIWKKFSESFPNASVVEDIIKIAIGEEKLQALGYGLDQAPFSPWEQVMSQIIAGDFFGADRIDYLLRDARSTGVSYGLFDYHQLIEMLKILPYQAGGKETLALGIEENGLESCEALLLARHFMHKRVYQYPSVQAYSFHVARFMKKLYQKEKPLHSIESYLAYTDNEILSELKRAFWNFTHEGHADALAVFVKKDRFLAIELPKHLQKEEIDLWKKQFFLTDQQVELCFTSKADNHKSFSFPVSKNGKIVDFVPRFTESILPVSPNWLYVAPECKDLVALLLSLPLGLEG